MKRIRTFIASSIVAGFLIVVPLYLAVLLLLKAMASLAGLVRPFAALLPDWMPAEDLLAPAWWCCCASWSAPWSALG